MQLAGGAPQTLNSILNGSLYYLGPTENFCQTFRTKKSLDTEAQKLLHTVLQFAAQGLSRAIFS
eukprot:SAG11_NODE_19516_length_465_cov_0.773224_1_plen_63_part_10